MNVIDLLVTIVVVTILVTIVLAIVTYVAYKLRLAREPSEPETAEDGLRYFVSYPPPGEREAARASAPDEGSQDEATETDEETLSASARETHAPEA